VTVAAAPGEPYQAGSGSVGVVLCHGFTGSPVSMRPWAKHLVGAGFRVSLPRLPGHGTTWQELNRTPWTAWYAEVDRAFTELSQVCSLVFVVGLSMGGTLALRLAEQHGAGVSGLVVVNPALWIADPRMRILPVLQLVLPSLGPIAGDIARLADDDAIDEDAYPRTPLRALHSQTKMWRDVRQNLRRVEQPLLVYRSEQDHVVDAASLKLLRAGVSSVDVTYVNLPRSYHVATLDYEAEEIFSGSVAFMRRLVKD